MKKIIETIKLEEGITVELLKEQLDERIGSKKGTITTACMVFKIMNPENQAEVHVLSFGNSYEKLEFMTHVFPKITEEISKKCILDIIKKEEATHEFI